MAETAGLEATEILSCVRGYHVYCKIWTPYINETLVCRRELGNLEDPYAVAVVKDEKDQHDVLHVLKKGQIICTVTGRRQYSADLPQGEMEIPCKYLFTGTGDAIRKIRRLLPKEFDYLKKESSSETVTKKVKIAEDKVADCEVMTNSSCDENDEVWLTNGCHFLKRSV